MTSKMAERAAKRIESSPDFDCQVGWGGVIAQIIDEEFGPILEVARRLKRCVENMQDQSRVRDRSVQVDRLLIEAERIGL